MCQVLRAHYVPGTVLGLGSRGHTDNGSCPHGSLVFPQELFEVFCPLPSLLILIFIYLGLSPIFALTKSSWSVLVLISWLLWVFNLIC